VLGVKKGASVKDIKAAFYRLSKKYHPDMHNGKSEAEKARGAEMFTEVYILTLIETTLEITDFCRLRSPWVGTEAPSL
jgi:hypothetical protein